MSAVPGRPTITYHRPPMYPLQERAFFTDKRYSLIEAGTKFGKTVGGIAWLIEQALLGKWSEYWWVAPVYSQAEIAYKRMKRGLDSRIVDANNSKLSLTLLNGNQIACKSAEKPDNLYGEDVGAAVMDEASRQREEAWHAMRTTLTATRGPVRIVGNVKGRKNWFYRMARQAEAGEPDMLFTRITADDAVEAGVIVREEVEQAKRVLPEKVFRELYMAEASDDEGNPFGVEAVRARKRPLSGEPVEAIGIDLAKSVDWTVVIGLDAEGNVALFDRFQLPWQDTIQRIDRLVGFGSALVDSTGVGDPILEQLQRQADGTYEGYHFSSTSKQKLMEGLAMAIHQDRVGYPEGTILSELEEFEYVYSRTGVKYSAPEGFHDDCVCALALAVQHQNAPAWELAPL